MKLLPLLLVISNLAAGQSTPQSFSVHVNLPSTLKGKYIYLTYAYFDTSGFERTDSQLLLSDKIIFTGSVCQPAPATISIKFGFPTGSLQPTEKAQITNLFLDEKIEIPFEFYLLPGETIITANESILESTISGQEPVLDFEKLQKAKSIVIGEMLGLFEELENCRLLGNEQCKQHLLNELLKAQEKIYNDIYLRYFKNHSNSPLALYALKQSIPGTLDKAEIYLAYLSQLPKNIKEFPQAISLKKSLEAYPNSDTGKYVKDFELLDTAGRRVTLRSFIGKYVFLDFWTTSTLLNRLSHPDLLPVWNKYKDKDFSIISIALETPASKEKWMASIRKGNMPWDHLTDFNGFSNTAAQQFGVLSVPFNLLIDPTGKILLRNVRVNELDIFLQQVMN